MTFSTAQYEATIDKLTCGLDQLSAKLQQVGPTVERATHHWYITQDMAEGIVWLGKKILELGSWILDKIIELMKGAAAPVLMFKAGLDWQDVRGAASTVAGDLKPELLSVSSTWHGSAAEAYGKQVKFQADAAAKLAAMSDKTATTLYVSAGAGLAFYVALAVILVKFIAAMITALAALGSAVFSWAGAALVVEEAGVNTGLIIAAVSALTAALGTQAGQMVVLHGEAVDNSTFPGGQWPNATPGRFSDGSVADGDADWSLEG